MRVITHLEDVTPPDVLARAKTDMGLDRMVTLASNENDLVRAVAVEAIGEELWRDPRKQHHVVRLGGLDALLAVCGNVNEPETSLVPALWSLRNVLSCNGEAQEQFDYRDGTVVVLAVLRKAFSGVFENRTDTIIEGCLAVFIAAINGHERNSRRLLLLALESIMDLAEGKWEHAAATATITEGGGGSDVVDRSYLRRAMRSDGALAALAKSILQMLGPYNYIVCKTCSKKQNLSGTSCIYCGNRLLIPV